MPPFIPPITPAEFFHLLQRCIPPTGWTNRIVVANSGGPDSTALLFLLGALVRQQKAVRSLRDDPALALGECQFPQTVCSAHVNHSLQDAATVMEETATWTAKQLNSPHVTEKIPWGKRPYPPIRDVDEKVAREARYSTLFQAMQHFNARIIAFAHHADDQVETALMRKTQGSSIRGLAAMRPVRRWGMGHRENDYYAFGSQGMRSWIVRPFLHVSKDRLLATCEAYKLDYVNDPTNFQPGLTFRNGVRRILSGKDLAQQPQQEDHSESSLKSADFEPYIQQLRAMVPDVRPADQLREAVRLYGMRLEEVDTQVTNAIARARIKSPPSTLLLRSPKLEETTDDEIRIALIRRCMRFASHGPWGAVWSEAGGNHSSLRRIANELWPPNLIPPSALLVDPETGVREDPRRVFTAGAGVNVYPVTVNARKGTISHRGCRVDVKDEEPGWIFARAPPHKKSPSLNMEAHAILDVTEELLAARRQGQSVYTALYDYRFAVHFDTTRPWPTYIEDGLSSGRARITIEPDTRWVLPQVVVSGEKTKTTCIGKFLWSIPGWQGGCRKPVRHQSRISMQFVRSLEAI